MNLKPACMSECMACNGVLTPQQKQPPKSVVTPPPALKFLTTPHPPPTPPTALKLFTPPLQLEMAASPFFTHGYFQQADFNIFGAII